MSDPNIGHRPVIDVGGEDSDSSHSSNASIELLDRTSDLLSDSVSDSEAEVEESETMSPRRSLAAGSANTATATTTNRANSSAPTNTSTSITSPTRNSSKINGQTIVGASVTDTDKIPKSVKHPAERPKPEPEMTSNDKEATSSSSSDVECPICLQTCIHPVQLPCSHVFCFLCVKGGANQSKRCALCRSEIPANYLYDPALVRKEDLLKEVVYDDGCQWFYEGMHGWWLYDERASAEIEERFKNKEKTFEILIAGFLYVVDLERKCQFRRNDPTRRRKIKRDMKTIPDKKGIAGLKYDASLLSAPVRRAGDGGEVDNNNVLVTRRAARQSAQSRTVPPPPPPSNTAPANNNQPAPPPRRSVPIAGVRQVVGSSLPVSTRLPVLPPKQTPPVPTPADSTANPPPVSQLTAQVANMDMGLRRRSRPQGRRSDANANGNQTDSGESDEE